MTSYYLFLVFFYYLILFLSQYEYTSYNTFVFV